MNKTTEFWLDEYTEAHAILMDAECGASVSDVLLRAARDLCDRSLVRWREARDAEKIAEGQD